MIVVKRVAIAPSRIFNLTDPRWLPEVARQWRGRYEWHDRRYEPLRILMGQEYVTEFERLTGHYTRLRESIRRDGVRDPVILSAGGLQTRGRWELPPYVDLAESVVSEYLGGSRIMIAKDLGLETIPAIVNDFGNVIPGGVRLRSAAEVADQFATPPRVEFGTFGTRPSVQTFSHMPDDYTMRDQIKAREKVVEHVKRFVVDWLEENDHD